MNRAQRTALFNDWLASLPVVRANHGPARGTIAGALVVLDRLKDSFDFQLDRHLASSGTQIKGASGVALKRILAELCETRAFVSEGGRTNRGLRDSIEKLLVVIGQMELERLSPSERAAELTVLQNLLVELIRAFHNQQRIKFIFDPSQTIQAHIARLLVAARETGKDGAVAQHLVGAKLQLRYPDIAIENNSATTADTQLGRAGDFLMGETVFHVTVAPAHAVIDKCRANLESGRLACLLVPARKIEATKQLADDVLAARISIYEIESFVAQNIDEIGEFCPASQLSGFARLLTIYNQRVDAAETDKSLLIEPPHNLAARV